MKIEQLTVENFKCFKREQTFDFSRLTILTGANSSGKSSVIYAILMALQTDNFPYQLSPNGNYINLGDYKEIIYNHDEKFNFKLNIVLSTQYEHIDFRTQWKLDKIDLLPTISEINIIEQNGESLTEYDGHDFNNLTIQIHLKQRFETNDIEKDCIDLENIFKKYYNQDKCKFTSLDSSNILVSNFDIVKYNKNKYSDESSEGVKPLLQNPLTRDILNSLTPRFDFVTNFLEKEHINFISAFRESPNRTYLEKNKANFKIGTQGEEYIDQIVEWDKRSNGKIKQLIKTMKELDLIEDIKINRLGGGRFEVLVKPINSNGFSALSDVGSGVSAFMPIIVADLQLHESSTLFLAEPEIHLHPSIQAKFIDYIIHKINTTDKNYVIETHSEYFLNRIRLAIVKNELDKAKLSVYYLENKKEDTDVHKIEFTETGVIKNAPRNFFETYSIDVMDIALNAFAE